MNTHFLYIKQNHVTLQRWFGSKLPCTLRRAKVGTACTCNCFKRYRWNAQVHDKSDAMFRSLGDERGKAFCSFSTSRVALLGRRRFQARYILTFWSKLILNWSCNIKAESKPGKPGTYWYTDLHVFVSREVVWVCVSHALAKASAMNRKATPRATFDHEMSLPKTKVPQNPSFPINLHSNFELYLSYHISNKPKSLQNPATFPATLLETKAWLPASAASVNQTCLNSMLRPCVRGSFCCSFCCRYAAKRMQGQKSLPSGKVWKRVWHWTVSISWASAKHAVCILILFDFYVLGCKCQQFTYLTSLPPLEMGCLHWSCVSDPQ